MEPDFAQCPVCRLTFPISDLDVVYGTCCEFCSDAYELHLQSQEWHDATWEWSDDENCSLPVFPDGPVHKCATFNETCWELPHIFGLEAMRPEVDEIPF